MASCGAADSDTAPGFPTLWDASNTGSTGVLTTYAGPFTGNTYSLTTAGATYENLIFDWTISIEAPNITVRNCLIDLGISGFGPPSYCVANSVGVENGGQPGFLLEDCTLTGAASAGITASSGTYRRLNISEHKADGIKFTPQAAGDDIILEDSYFRGLGSIALGASAATTHSDAIQVRAGYGSDLIVQGCNFDLGHTLTDPNYVFLNSIILAQTGDAGVQGNMGFNECYFSGGVNMMAFRNKDFGDPESNSITNSIWHPNEWSNLPYISESISQTITGNRRSDTGVNVDSLIITSTAVW